MRINGRRGAILRIPSFSSHGGERAGSGRKRTHRRTTELVEISIIQLRRAAALESGVRFTLTRGNMKARGVVTDQCLSLTTGSSEIAVALTRTNCGFGGWRWWFSCPLCKARVAIVFLDAPLCGCRRCLDLRYPSQSEGWIERSWRREDAIRRKLIGNDRKRRKGLHRRTINRLMKDALKEEERRSRAAVAFLLHM